MGGAKSSTPDAEHTLKQLESSAKCLYDCYEAITENSCRMENLT